MIKAQELRCGNLVEANTSKDIWIVITVFPQDILKASTSPDTYRPIPLSEEWLKRAGFKLHTGDERCREYWIGHNPITRDFMFMLIAHNDKIFYRNGYHTLIYLHQLQNLYFCLTGEELSINLGNQ